MERLTIRNSDGTVSQPTGTTVESVFYRLADYEDTELAPGEVRSMYGEWQAMMSVLNSIGGYDRLRELAEADKAERVMVLKCKPGDTVYLIKFWYLWADRPIAAKVERIGNYVRAGLLYTAVTRDKVMRRFVGADVGKTVFLTREEAEKALEEAKRHG